MRVPLSWLAVHVDIDVSAATTLAERLTFAGIEIETIHRVGDDLAGVLTARVLEVSSHPDADRLVLVRIDAGGEDRSVVCGARNFAPGDVVPWAAPGAKLPGGIEVGRRKVRGAWSDGMLASARELGVCDDHSGILVLPPDTRSAPTWSRRSSCATPCSMSRTPPTGATPCPCAASPARSRCCSARS